MTKNKSKKQTSKLKRLLTLILLLIIIISTTTFWNTYIKPIAVIGNPDNTLPLWKANLLRAQLIPHIKQLTFSDPYSQEMIEFVVKQGEPASTVSARLANHQLIPSADLLTNYMIYRGLDYRIQSGYFQFNKSMNTIEIANALTSSMPTQVSFYVWPGWRYEQLAESLSLHPHLSVNKNLFIALAKRNLPIPKEYTFINYIPKNQSLEGYFYPGQYSFPPKANTYEIITILLDTFNKNTLNIQSINNITGLTLHETITLASIVQREMMVPTEAPYIASVFINRLNYGMPLGADATTQYALATKDNWWPKLIVDPRTINSEYNTYVFTGLPPGPISNPGKDAIESVTKPPATEFLYFRAACDSSGKHNFSYTYEQHLNLSCN